MIADIACVINRALSDNAARIRAPCQRTLNKASLALAPGRGPLNLARWNYVNGPMHHIIAMSDNPPRGPAEVPEERPQETPQPPADPGVERPPIEVPARPPGKD
jgi:hypothetical protein